jgi:hypothetical protein
VADVFGIPVLRARAAHHHDAVGDLHLGVGDLSVGAGESHPFAQAEGAGEPFQCALDVLVE